MPSSHAYTSLLVRKPKNLAAALDKPELVYSLRHHDFWKIKVY